MRHLLGTIMLLAILGLGTLAGAQEFFEDFESYAVGSDLHGQNGWKGWDNTPSAGAPASDDYAFSGSNSVEIIPTADLVHEFDITGGRWQVSAMQYIPSGTAGTTAFIMLNTYGDGEDTKDWSIQTEYNLDSGFVSYLYGGSAQIIYDRWVELKYIIDLDKDTVDKYYDGELVVTWQWDDDDHGTLQCINLFGNGASSIYYDDIAVSQYFVYKAREPIPADGTVGVSTALLQWVAGDTAVSHDVYFATSPELTTADLVSASQTSTTYSHAAELEPGITYYWRVDEVAADQTTYTGDVWSFTARPLTAYAPSPTDEAVVNSQALHPSWQPGPGAVAHHIYFGDNYDAVVAGDPKADMCTITANSFGTGLLRAGTTYYWRVDTTDEAGELRAGEVWSFTTSPPVNGKIVREWWGGVWGFSVESLRNNPRYPNDPDGSELIDAFEGPVNWSDGYGSRLFGWLKPVETGDYTFWIASDDHSQLWLSTDANPANVRMIAEVPNETEPHEWAKYPDGQKSDVITLQAGKRYYLEAIMKEWRDSDHIAVAWQPPGGSRQVIPAGHVDTYALPPVKASMPSPAHGAMDTAQSLILNWLGGQHAAQHDVYLGDDLQAVREADTASADIYKGRKATASTPSGVLGLGKTYYWRVDEVQPEGLIVKGAEGRILKGEIWKFTTADYIPVDTFESYANEVGRRVFEVWIDGVGFSAEFWGGEDESGNGSGAVVGHDIWNPSSPHYNRTIVETARVAQGEQAMPLSYNNTAWPYYSEAQRTWVTPQDWTIEGVDTLSLWIKGKADNAAELLYIAISDEAGHVATIVHPDAAAAKNLNWRQWTIALSAAADAGVDLSAVVRLAIGVGDSNVPTAGGSGMLFIDDIRVIRAVHEE